MNSTNSCVRCTWDRMVAFQTHQTSPRSITRAMSTATASRWMAASRRSDSKSMSIRRKTATVSASLSAFSNFHSSGVYQVRKVPEDDRWIEIPRICRHNVGSSPRITIFGLASPACGGTRDEKKRRAVHDRPYFPDPPLRPGQPTRRDDWLDLLFRLRHSGRGARHLRRQLHRQERRCGVRGGQREDYKNQ